MYYPRPGLGDVAANNHHSEVVRIGDRIEMSGQGRLLTTISADSLIVYLRFSNVMPPFFASHILSYGKITNVLNPASCIQVDTTPKPAKSPQISQQRYQTPSAPFLTLSSTLYVTSLLLVDGTRYSKSCPTMSISKRRIRRSWSLWCKR